MTLIKCSPTAYAKCPTRQYCAPSADGCEFVEGSDCDKFNQEVLFQSTEKSDVYNKTVKRLARMGISDATAQIIALAEEVERCRVKIRDLETLLMR